MPLLDDLADVLSSQGLGTLASTIFLSELPSTPDTLLALYATAGGSPVRTMAAGPGAAIAERPHVAIHSRATHPANAQVAANNVVRTLDGLTRTINNVAYRSIFAIQSPFFLGTDDLGRAVYVVNFEVIKDPATSS